MTVQQPLPSLRLLWPEHAPEDADTLDHESAIIAERRAKAFRSFSRGLSMRVIGEELKCNASTVCRDVNHVLDSYRLVAIQDAASHVMRELGRLAAIESELWDAWERSKGEQTEKQMEKGVGRTHWKDSRMKKRQRDGNPQWMKLIGECWDRRCKLLGLLKPEDFTGKNSLPPMKLVAGFDPVEVV